ncbi:MAG: HEPN domain-containing protein [Chitinophagaceae bacterium]|nr:HEPN domain-containing protein [Chitinophagaceae bacterium]
MTQKTEAIQLKLKKAQALLAEVDIQIQNRFYGTAINRLYYSCYHITKALLLTQDLVPKTHSGVATILYQHFVVNGNFDKSHAAFFSKLMHERIDDDYSDFLVSEYNEIAEFIEPAKAYVSYVDSLLSSYLFQPD